MSKISLLPVAGPLDGSERIPLVQEGQTKGINPADHLAYIALGAEMARDQAADLVLPQNIFVDVALGVAEAAVPNGTIFKLVDTVEGVSHVRKRTVGGSDFMYDELTAAAFADRTKGARLAAFAADIPGSATRDAHEKLDERRTLLDGVTLFADREAILGKTDTADRSGLVNTKFAQNRAFAGKTLRMAGSIFADDTILFDQTMTVRGEGATRLNLDNSWDQDNAGTRILGRSLTEDVVRFDSGLRDENGRLHADLGDLLIVGNRLDHEIFDIAPYDTPTDATAGNGVTFAGGPDAEDGTQQLVITTRNLAVTQARMHNIELRDNTFGSSLINTQVDRAGGCGLFADDGGEGGESYFGGFTRGFQNGHDATLPDTLRAGAHIRLGTWGASMLSLTENRGCNGVLGGIFSIAVYQSESGALGIAGSSGRQTLLFGARRAEMPVVSLAPGPGFDGAVVYLDATSRNVRLGGEINTDALGANGRHFEIENGFENLDVSMLLGIASVRDKRTTNFETKTGGFAFARNAGVGTATGDGTIVLLDLAELIDTRNRLSADDNWYQALFNEQVIINGGLTLEGVGPAHTAGMIYIEVEEGDGWTSTGNYGRQIPFNPANMRNTETNSCHMPLSQPILLRGANSERAAGMREGAKVRIRYQVSGGGNGVTLVGTQSYLSFMVV